MNKYFIPDPLEIGEQFLDNIFSHFDKVLKNKKNDKFILSVSGGSDSVLLLYILIKYLKFDKERIIICHVNHHLRNDSDIDESFVSILGSKLNIETHIRHLNPKVMPRGKSVESWARNGRYDLLEKYIPGREITVGILNGEALPIVEILPSHEIYDYKCKYTPGMTKYICPADLGEDLKNRIMLDSLKIFELLNCRGYGRVDYIIDNNNYYFLEINTLPGMTNTSLLPIAAKNADISFNKLVKIIIELGLSD